MTHHSDAKAASLGLAKLRNPNIRSKAVLRIEAEKLLARYGAEGCIKQVGYVRDSEAAKWTGILWRASPRMSAKEANLAGWERAAKESSWLFAAGALDLDPDVQPGPYTLAPPHHVGPGGDPRKVDVPIKTSESPYTKPKEARRVSSDDDLFASARDTVRAASPHLTGAAFHAAVHKTFRAMRDAQRKPRGAR